MEPFQIVIHVALILFASLLIGFEYSLAAGFFVFLSFAYQLESLIVAKGGK